jgi:FKBP-type peptidyl-prolyl cis-trans isomerase 2
MLTASTDFNFRVAGQTVDLDVQITAIAASLDTVANRMAIAELVAFL